MGRMDCKGKRALKALKALVSEKPCATVWRRRVFCVCWFARRRATCSQGCVQTAVVICQVKHPIGDKPVAAVATNDHQKTHNTGVELVSHINSLGFLVALILDNTPPPASIPTV